MYTQVNIGEKYTKTFKTYVQFNGVTISPFHDIPAYIGQSEDIVNVVNEIPRFENAKFEMNKKEKMNPIMQDTKKEKVRFVPNIFPLKGYPWNYGAIPQTWEDPDAEDDLVNEYGDNDPIDVIDLGKKRKKIGEVYQAKILGCLALIDEGECDWKIVVVDIADERAASLNDIKDVENMFPGLLALTFKWFRDYKVPSGSPESRFGFNGEFQNKELAMKVIKNAHKSWINLVEKNLKDDILKYNACIKGSQKKLENPFEIKGSLGSDTSLPDLVNEYCFIK